jgi:glycerate kinase
MKIIVAPDKFKGSLSSMPACKAIEAGIREVISSAEVWLFPMADGGDGFDEVMQYYLQTQTVDCNTVGPLMQPMHTTYQINTTTKTAIIALAAASGLVLLNNEDRNPLLTTTYGTGLMIKHAVAQGAEKIILGLGGSATNDAGMGILAALGFQLQDGNGNSLEPVGRNLQSISCIIPPPQVPSVNFQIACDVENVLFGRDGAAFVYALQKGASKDDIDILDKGLEHIANIIHQQTGRQVANVPGAGAAGGVAAGLLAYFECEIIPGANLVMEASKILQQINHTSLLITGEGKLDTQSSKGKVVQHIARLGKENHIPVMALCGMVEATPAQINKWGLYGAYPIMDGTISQEDAMDNAEVMLKQLSQTAMGLFLQSLS